MESAYVELQKWTSVSPWVEDPTSYAIVIDGGSSGSRVHVYSMHVEHGKMPRLKAKEAVLKVQPGLSTFSEDPSKAGESLRPGLTLVHFPAQPEPLLSLTTVSPTSVSHRKC